MATRIEELYEEDFHVWTQLQAETLRRLAETRPNLELDFPRLIEEVEDGARASATPCAARRAGSSSPA